MTLTTAPIGVGETSNTGSSTIAISPSRNIEVGEFLVVMLTERDWGISSLADNSTQTGTANSYTQDVLKNTQDPFVYIYSCKVTRKILTTDAITATFAGPNGGKGMCVLVLPDAAASSQLDKSITMNAANQSTYWTNATALITQPAEYAVGVCAFSISTVSAGTITTDAPWTQEFTATPASGYACVMGSLVLTATGTPEMTGGWGATHDGQQEGAIATYRATMDAPAFQNAGAGDAVAGDINVPYPASIAAGDLLLLHLFHRGTPDSDPTASGFTKVVGDFAAGDSESWVFAKSAVGTESGSLSVARPGGSDAFAGRMYRVTEWLNDATIANNFESITNTAGSGTSISAPSVTTVGADRLCVAFISFGNDDTLDEFTGETGGNWTEAVAEFTSTIGSDLALGLQTATLTSQGTISGGSDTTVNSRAWRVLAFAIKPVAVAADDTFPYVGAGYYPT